MKLPRQLLLVLAVPSAMALRRLPTKHHVERVLETLGSPPDVTRVNASYFNSAVADHFDSLFSHAWSQRYYVDDRFWCGSGCPVFLYIGGEGPQSAPSPALFMWTLAEKHSALMLSLEHRFYGESRPTRDMSDLSLRLLTSEQALEDLATFVS
jgi:serine protease 16